MVKYFALQYPAEAREQSTTGILVLLHPRHGVSFEGRVGETVFTVAKLPQKLNPARVQGDIVIEDVDQYTRHSLEEWYRIVRCEEIELGVSKRNALRNLKRAARTAAPATTSA